MRKPQSGRSMIEMLGVLVLIGVLSVAALFGFTYALNKHRANETIHDVMLRASNVPMTDEYYQTRPTGYAFKFPDLQDELSTMGYTLNTVKNSEYGYVYKVEAEAIPYRVCNLILRLEPTDIDEIRIGADKAVYKRGLWELCETHVDEATDTVLMSFYFEKACTTNADCSTCQECYQGRCKANYDLPGCGDNPTPVIPPPPVPIPDESCLETVEYQYGDNCEYTGECCINPLAEGCPPSCTPKGCPTAPTCGTCEIKVYDAEGCHVGCQMTSCCPAPECSVGDVFDEDKCTCQSSDCPAVEKCGECEIKVYDAEGCHVGCQMTSCCPAPECRVGDVFDEVSCTCQPEGCEPFTPCTSCEITLYDEHGCPVGCEVKQCEPCPSGEVEIGQDTCGCPICQSDECPNVGTDSGCSALIEDTTSIPGEVCYTWGPTQLTTKSGGECCDSVVECCPLKENCSEECHPSSCEDVFGEVPSGEDPQCYESVIGGETSICGVVCQEDGYQKKVCTPCSAGEEETGTDVCGCPICEEKCPDLSCEACQEPNYESCTCEPKVCNLECPEGTSPVGDDGCGCPTECTTCPDLSCEACQEANYTTCTCEPKVCNLECPEGTSPVGDDGCGCPTECTTCPDLSCEACQEPNYESCTCEPKVCTLECEEGEEATGYDSCGCPTGCSRPCTDDWECSGSCSVCEGGYCVDKTEQQDISECCDGSLYTSCCPLNGNNCGCTADTCDLVVPEIPVGQEACYESVPEGGEICGEVCSGGYKKKACPSGDHCPVGEREIGRDECGCPYCEVCPEDETSCGTECCVVGLQFCCGESCCPTGHACCEGVCCGEGEVCGNNGSCCPTLSEPCGECEIETTDTKGCPVCAPDPSCCNCPEPGEKPCEEAVLEDYTYTCSNDSTLTCQQWNTEECSCATDADCGICYDCISGECIFRENSIVCGEACCDTTTHLCCGESCCPSEQECCNGVCCAINQRCGENGCEDIEMPCPYGLAPVRPGAANAFDSGEFGSIGNSIWCCNEGYWSIHKCRGTTYGDFEDCLVRFTWRGYKFSEMQICCKDWTEYGGDGTFEHANILLAYNATVPECCYTSDHLDVIGWANHEKCCPNRGYPYYSGNGGVSCHTVKNEIKTVKGYPEDTIDDGW